MRALLILDMVEQARTSQGRVSWNLDDLIESGRRLRPNFNPPRVVEIRQITPTVRTKMMTVSANSRGTKLWQQVINFFKVDYVEEQDQQHPLSAQTKQGQTVFAAQLRVTENPVTVRCNCPDFFFTWNYHDRNNPQGNALFGRIANYQRKTTTYPARNPIEVPGVCKHIIGVTERLRRDRILL